MFTTREYIRVVSEVNIDWLKEIAPHYYNSNDLMDESKKKMPKAGQEVVSFMTCLLQAPNLSVEALKTEDDPLGFSSKDHCFLAGLRSARIR